MKLSDYVIDFIARAGVKHIFMLTGGGCMHLVDSVGRTAGLEYVCCLHEQACAFAAEHYAEFNNGLGAALVTTGPGGTNAVTGVAAAWLESASVLFLSGQVKRADLIGARGVRTMGPQEVDIVSVVKPITKYAVTVMDPESIRYEMEKALHLATEGRRGPVWIEIPLDVQAATIDETRLRGYQPEPTAAASALAGQVSQVIELLHRAERPVVMLGNGARGAAKSGLLERLLDLLPIPVLLTWKAIDLMPENHPLYAGRPGSVAQRGANFTQQTSDFVLALGARLDLMQTAFSHRNFAPDARKAMVDIDPAELDKMQTPIDVSICDDVSEFLDEFLRQAYTLTERDRAPWMQRAKTLYEKYPVVLPEYWKSDGYVNTYVLVDTLADVTTPDDIFVPGSSGPCSEVFLQAYRVQTGQRVTNAPSLGAMGTGLPGSIGACLASGRKRTICVNGDGGFQLNIQELETVRRLSLPIKFFVLCNGAYGSIMNTQHNYFQDRFVGSNPSSQLTLPDITRVAAAYGIQTTEISGHEGLAESVREVLDRPGPIVCAVSVSPMHITAPRVTSFVRADGAICSNPMEDLWPLLPREEFHANMRLAAEEHGETALEPAGGVI
jgi:acetolactate synthase I/II/III large subunit